MVHWIMAYSTEAFAVFGDATWHVTDRLDIFAGVRYTEEDLELRLSNQMMFARVNVCRGCFAV